MPVNREANEKLLARILVDSLRADYNSALREWQTERGKSVYLEGERDALRAEFDQLQTLHVARDEEIAQLRAEVERLKEALDDEAQKSSDWQASAIRTTTEVCAALGEDASQGAVAAADRVRAKVERLADALRKIRVLVDEHPFLTRHEARFCNTVDEIAGEALDKLRAEAK